MAKLTDDALEGLLDRYQHSAVGAYNGSIATQRGDLIDRYFGERYGDEVEGRSQVVMTDVRDTIESIKPELMEIFFGGDKVLEFEPVGAEDTDAAEQETAVVNHMITQKNEGFMVFLEWFTDALLQKTGYVKRYWDETERSEIEEYDDLTPEEAEQVLASVMADDAEVEILERWGGPELDEETGLPVIDPATGGPVMEPIGFKLRVTQTEPRYRIECIPPEEVRVMPEWHRLDFDGCPFVAHRRAVSESDLIEMGFDRKTVESLPTYEDDDTDEHDSRFDQDRASETDLGVVHEGAMRQVLLYENYVRADRDGDGVAELLRAYTSEHGQLLKRDGKVAVEEVAEVAIDPLCPMPVPHKHYGLSVAELVQDLQRIKTVLTRQLLDNIVYGNNEDVVVDSSAADEATYQDLAVTQPGRNIRVPGGMASIGKLPIQQMAQQSLQAIEYVDSLRENRTGVTRYNQGMDADSLNKTASGVRQIMSAAQRKVLLIARIFAETGVRRLFLGVHRDLRRGPLKKITMRLRNDWVDVDPRTWRHRADMTVSVGLGTGNKDQQIAYLDNILSHQKEGLQAGMVGYEHIHHTLTKMVELAGFKDARRFFPEPEELAEQQQAQQDQPDPMDMIAQAEAMKAEADAAKTQAGIQKDRAQLMMDQAKFQQAQAKEEHEARMKLVDARLKDFEAKTKRLDVMLKDDRERDIAEAQLQREVDGPDADDPA